MKKFRFRLSPLLTLKKRKEDEEIRKFSEIVSGINLLREEQDEMKFEITQLGNEINEKIGKGFGIRDYTEFSELSRYLNLKISNLENDIKEKQPELEMARIRLNEASKEKKILEILQENEYKKYRKKIQKEEKQEIEEFITTHNFLNRDSIEFQENESKALSEKERKDWENRQSEQDEIIDDKKELSDFDKLKEYYDSFNK